MYLLLLQGPGLGWLKIFGTSNMCYVFSTWHGCTKKQALNWSVESHSAVVHEPCCMILFILHDPFGPHKHHFPIQNHHIWVFCPLFERLRLWCRMPRMNLEQSWTFIKYKQDNVPKVRLGSPSSYRQLNLKHKNSFISFTLHSFQPRAWTFHPLWIQLVNYNWKILEVYINWEAIIRPLLPIAQYPYDPRLQQRQKAQNLLHHWGQKGL